jgi:hypothetical protein
MSDYDTDILIWSERQAELLRRRAAGELITEADLGRSNIAEEIEAMGRSQLHAVESLVQTLQHMLKAEAWCSPVTRAFAGWPLWREPHGRAGPAMMGSGWAA